MKNNDKDVKKSSIEIHIDIQVKNKFRFLGLTLLVVMLIAVSLAFANVDSRSKKVAIGTQAVKTAAPSCERRVSIVIDRSSSIGVTSAYGSPAYVTQVRNFAKDLIDDIAGPNTYSDLYAFGTKAARINTGGWFKLDTPAQITTQKDFTNWPFLQIKQGANSNDSGDIYGDEFDADSEGLTNWDGALTMIKDYNNARPTEIANVVIFFTDGNPTTNNGEIAAEQPPGGNLTFDDTEQSGTDLSDAVTRSNEIRAQGTAIIPVGIGSRVNENNLKAIAGAGNYYAMPNTFADLSNFLGAVIDNIPCPTTPTNVHLHTFEKLYDGTFVGIPSTVTLDGVTDINGDVTTTAVGWTTKTFNTGTDWEISAVVSLPTYYEAVSERCERDKWTGTPPFIYTDREWATGVNGAVLMRDQAVGGDTYCEFVIQDSRDPIKTNIEMYLDPPVPAAIFEEGSDTATVKVRIKNTGVIDLTNVKTIDGLCGTGNLAVGITVDCPDHIVEAPGLGSPNPTWEYITGQGTATIDPTTQYFVGSPTPPVTYSDSGNSRTVSITRSTSIGINRIKLPV